MDTKEPTIIVTHRRTSRLTMRIAKNGDVRVSAPYRTPDREVQAFIEQHKEWIEKARARSSEREQTRQAFYAQLSLKTRAEWADARARLDAIVRPIVEVINPRVGTGRSCDQVLPVRRVLNVAEITGFENDDYKINELFYYKQRGADMMGRAIGNFFATGNKPEFLERLNSQGIKLPEELFDARQF